MAGQFFGNYALHDLQKAGAPDGVVEPRLFRYEPDPFGPFGYAPDPAGPHGGKVILLDEGFETDLATVPRPFWSLGIDPWGFRRAALVHDWLWELDRRGQKFLSFAESNDVLREACRTLGLARWKCWCIYRACQLFGGYLWLKHPTPPACPPAAS